MTCSSLYLAGKTDLRSRSSYTANRLAGLVLPGRPDLVSAAGAFTIGILGNLYSRVAHGTAFTSMVTGVLFLVPVRQYLLFLVYTD